LYVAWEGALLVEPRPGLERSVPRLIEYVGYAWQAMAKLDNLLTRELEKVDLNADYAVLQRGIQRMRRVRLFGERLRDESRIHRYSLWADHLKIVSELYKAWLMDGLVSSVEEKMRLVETVQAQVREEAADSRRNFFTVVALLFTFITLAAAAAQVISVVDPGNHLAIEHRVIGIGGTPLLLGVVVLGWYWWVGARDHR
jgi:hypothetical protein